MDTCACSSEASADYIVAHTASTVSGPTSITVKCELCTGSAVSAQDGPWKLSEGGSHLVREANASCTRITKMHCVRDRHR